MEEKGIRVCQMLEEMLENQEISQEEEGKIRKLFEEREDRRAEVRIAYDLLNLLQKEVRNEAAPVRMPGNQYGADLCNGFGTSLYQARLQARITQQQLEDVTGINQADISRIERGISNPSLATIQRLADGLGMGLSIEFV
ncbi:helix-turn-helix transcriptional regulator [Lachnospiraceae bacterium JLR.KK009]